MGLFNLPATWFWKEIVLRGLLSVFPGGSFTAARGNGHTVTINSGNGLDVMNLGQTWAAMGTLNLWIGVAIGIGLIAAAIWFRRWRDDS